MSNTLKVVQLLKSFYQDIDLKEDKLKYGKIHTIHLKDSAKESFQEMSQLSVDKNDKPG